MHGERRTRRRGVSAWASWCLAGWVAVCTVCYLYAMTAEQRGQWLRSPDATQVAETQVKEGS